jgi:hypothetical protein
MGNGSRSEQQLCASDGLAIFRGLDHSHLQCGTIDVAWA